jgi:hypothetical protein
MSGPRITAPSLTPEQMHRLQEQAEQDTVAGVQAVGRPPKRQCNSDSQWPTGAARPARSNRRARSGRPTRSARLFRRRETRDICRPTSLSR